MRLTACDTTGADIRVREVETIYRLSIDGMDLSAPYYPREIAPYSTATKRDGQ